MSVANVTEISATSSKTFVLDMPQRTDAPPGRNEPCRCGSGRKYKHCCLAKDDEQAGVRRAAAAAAEESVQSSEEKTVTAAPARKTRTEQPWKATTATRGFVPRSRTPRKVGGG